MPKFLIFTFFIKCLLFAPVFSSAFAASLSGEQLQAFESIAKQFTKSPNMIGDFIQFHPDGQQSEGHFSIKRPGKIRFDYKPPYAILVKADGKTVGVHNSKLNTWDYYPLRKTPLSLLLAEKIDVDHDSIESVNIESELVTVVMADKSLFGNSKISLMFDPNNYDLRQWTVHDQQGKDTTVVIYNVQRDVEIKDDLFFLEKRNQ